jgi:D-serine dehydratase
MKGLPLGSTVPFGDIGTQGWNILAGDTSTPVAVLRDSALTANAEAMRSYCAAHGVALAPHAKTHMSPQLVARQLAAGAWGMTAAVPLQVEVLLGFGVRRILVANQVTDPAALRWLSTRLRDDPSLEILWYVDSLAGVRLAAEAMAGAARPGRVLLEVGYAGGRTGVRSLDQARSVASAVVDGPGLELAGIAGFEGLIGGDRSPETHARVTSFLSFLRDTYVALDDAGSLGDGERIATAGGSAFFDQVVETLGPLRDRGATVVLRSGCYLTHDDGFYASITPLGDAPRFVPAIEVWGRVLSRPEPQVALLNLGRRDVSFDLGLPVPLRIARDGLLLPASDLTVTALGDQHAWLAVPADHDLAVGDLVGVGVSHPCTTFDKWPLLMLVDDGYTVVGGVRTHF